MTLSWKWYLSDPKEVRCLLYEWSMELLICLLLKTNLQTSGKSYSFGGFGAIQNTYNTKS
jgi:hypothetical protein